LHFSHYCGFGIYAHLALLRLSHCRFGIDAIAAYVMARKASRNH